MPFYQIRNKTTNEEYETYLSISAMEKLLKDRNLEQVLSFPAIVSGTERTNRPDSGMRELLTRIKKNNIRSNIKTHQ